MGGASFTIIEGSVWASVRLTQLGTNPEGSELWRWSPGAPAFERVAAVGPERSLSRAVAVGGEVVWVEAARRVDSVPSGRIMATRLAPSGIGTPRVVAELPFWPFGSDSTQDLFAGGEGHVVVFETEAPFDYWPIAANAHVYRLSDGRHWRVPVHASQAWGIAGGELWFASPGAYTDLHRFRLDALGPGD